MRRFIAARCLLFCALVAGLAQPAQARSPGEAGRAAAVVEGAPTPATSPSDEPAPSWWRRMGRALWERDEPQVRAGIDALADARFDDALAAFRAAAASTREERAVVEYDVGQALLQQGQAERAAAREGAEPGAPGQQQLDPETRRVFEEAEDAFERAYGLSQQRSLRSAAAHAQGNARAEAGDLRGAAASYRRALASDPTNQDALDNLARVLRVLAAQPPPSGGGEPGDESGEGEESDEGQQGEAGKQGEQGDAGGERPQGEEGAEGEAGQQEGSGTDESADTPPGGPKTRDDPSPGDDPGASDGSGPGVDGGPARSPSGPPEQDAADERAARSTPDKAEAPPKTPGQEQAARRLDRLRARERPLSPLWMRTPAKPAAPPEKDW